MPELTIVDLSNNHISDLTPLAGLKKLRTVTLTHNDVTDISPLVGSASLATLDIAENALDCQAQNANLQQLISSNVSVQSDCLE
jgi:Leucine-rich repeat (LRR) protein